MNHANRYVKSKLIAASELVRTSTAGTLRSLTFKAHETMKLFARSIIEGTVTDVIECAVTAEVQAAIGGELVAEWPRGWIVRLYFAAKERRGEA